MHYLISGCQKNNGSPENGSNLMRWSLSHAFTEEMRNFTDDCSVENVGNLKKVPCNLMVSHFARPSCGFHKIHPTIAKIGY
jgi:hypothetical protein